MKEIKYPKRYAVVTRVYPEDHKIEFTTEDTQAPYTVSLRNRRGTGCTDPDKEQFDFRVGTKIKFWEQGERIKFSLIGK